MNKFVVALGAFAVTLSTTAIAAEGVDMKGNKVAMPENFTYGGDNTAAYAGGKIATGVKDPAVCGTFKEESCSIKYTEK
jgi:hypothetical protein